MYDRGLNILKYSNEYGGDKNWLRCHAIVLAHLLKGECPAMPSEDVERLDFTKWEKADSGECEMLALQIYKDLAQGFDYCYMSLCWTMDKLRTIYDQVANLAVFTDAAEALKGDFEEVFEAIDDMWETSSSEIEEDYIAISGADGDTDCAMWYEGPSMRTLAKHGWSIENGCAVGDEE